MKKILLSVSLLTALLCGCSRSWLDSEGQDKNGAGNGDGFSKSEVPGMVPESGVPLKAVMEGGLSLLSFPGMVSNTILGSIDSGNAYPVLFFQCADNDGNEKLYKCTYQETTQDGRLVYGAPKELAFPWNAGSCVRIISASDMVMGLVLTSNSLTGYSYNAASESFDSTPAFSASVSGIENTVYAFDLTVEGNGNWTVAALCDDGSVYLPDVSKEHTLYNSANIYIGNLPYARLYSFSFDPASHQCLGAAALMSGTVEDIVGPSGLARISTGHLVGSCLSGIAFCPSGGKAQRMASSEGKALDNRCSITGMAVIKGNSFICSGEGPVYYYEAENSSNTLSFKAATPLMMKSGELYAGSCSVPSVADWDQDGALDIISGTSDGRIAFFKNHGTDAAPAFGEPVFLQADGQEVCIRSGYYNLNGPLYGAYGYMSPTVFDWNGDGIPDIIYSSNAIRTCILLGTGKEAPNCLESPMVLNLDGIDLWGRWKVRPAVTEYNGEVWLANLDEDDALHLYRKGGLVNVHDCGVLLLKDGSVITGHRPLSVMPSVLEQGDVKLEFTDWDGDGDPDLLIGCTAVSSFPNTYEGIPYNLGSQNMQMIILENITTDDGFVFDYPRLFKFRRGDYYLGSGAKAPVSCDFGDSKRGPNMLVGADDGKFYYFERHDLSEQRIW